MLKEGIYGVLMELFDGERLWDENYGMSTATHIIVALRCPKGTITDEEYAAMNFYLRMERPRNPPELIVYIYPEENEAVEYFVAVMK